MAMSPVDFFPKADRGVQKSTSADSAEGLLSKKSAKGAAGKDSARPFALELDNARNSERDSTRDLRGGEGRSAPSRSDRLAEEGSMPRAEKTPVKFDKQPVRNLSESRMSQLASGPKNVQEPVATDTYEEQASVLKERAVLDFMSEMQNRFGVAPDDIVSAFASMDPETLKGRPEDAMTEFLAALQIPSQQMPDAAKLYQKLVSETGQSVLNEQMGDGRQPVNMNVIGASDVRKMRLNESLDTMSNRFFRQGEVQPGMPGQPGLKGLGQEWDSALDPNAMQDAQNFEAATGAGDSANSAVSQKQNDANQSDSKKSSAGLMGGLVGIVGSATAAAGAVAAATANGTQAPGMSAKATPAAAANPALVDASTLNSLTETSVEDGADLTGGEESLGQFSAGAGAAAAMGATAGAEASSAVPGASMFAAAAKVAMSETSSDKKKEGTEADAAAGGLAGAGFADAKNLNSHTGAKIAGPAGMMATQPQITPEQKQENIQELIRNAQVIMRKGGGEMKMQLKPEGIGQVNLKVLVQDGQVNVQMITENDSAKKLLENGLSELKSQLATNKLHVETLKVDVAGEAAKQKFEHNQSDAQRDHARQFASDFLGNFRDDRQAFRQGFFDDFGNRAYNRSQKRGPMNPAPVEGSSNVKSANERRGSDSSRRLNLVA